MCDFAAALVGERVAATSPRAFIAPTDLVRIDKYREHRQNKGDFNERKIGFHCFEHSFIDRQKLN